MANQISVLQNHIKAFGYRCDTVDDIFRSVWDGDFTVNCNDLRYVYEVYDHGGNWLVKVK